jgi:hypothetical protein
MELDRLAAEFAELKKQLVQIGYVCTGSIMALYRKCGKPNCGCQESTGMQHGPYHIWTRKEKGKTVTRSLTEIQARCCSEYIQNFKKMENIIEQMKRISARIIEQRR